MAQAYSVLANDGIKVDLYVISRIEDAAGVVIYEHKQEPERILSPEAVFVTNDILSDVARYTTAAGLRIDRPVAAKTGTTDGFRDAYLVAYTPNLVVSFWMGYDIQNMGRIENGWNYTTGFVREITQKALADLPVEVFPDPVQGCRGSLFVPNRVTWPRKTVLRLGWQNRIGLSPGIHRH
jgi:membrane peptidoglycan carboxypeptidase